MIGPLGRARAGCYSQAALSSNDSKTLYLTHSPPLVVRVDVPDDALREDLVLVHGDEQSQGERGQPLHHDRVGWL